MIVGEIGGVVGWLVARRKGRIRREELKNSQDSGWSLFFFLRRSHEKNLESGSLLICRTRSPEKSVTVRRTSELRQGSCPNHTPVWGYSWLLVPIRALENAESGALQENDARRLA